MLAHAWKVDFFPNICPSIGQHRTREQGSNSMRRSSDVKLCGVDDQRRTFQLAAFALCRSRPPSLHKRAAIPLNFIGRPLVSNNNTPGPAVSELSLRNLAPLPQVGHPIVLPKSLTTHRNTPQVSIFISTCIALFSKSSFCTRTTHLRLNLALTDNPSHNDSIR
jgi:hypothetical protein